MAAGVGRRLLIDRLAAWVIRGGGIVIIGAIVAILFVIFYEVYPLLKNPTLERVATVPASTENPEAALAVGVDEYREIAYVIGANGLALYPLDGKKALAPPTIDLGGATVASVSPVGHGPFVLGLSDGRALPIKVTFTSTYADGKRAIAPEVDVDPAIKVEESGRPLLASAYADAPNGPVAAAIVGDQEVAIATVEETTPMIGDPVREETRRGVTLEGKGKARMIVVDGRGDNVFVGDDRGQVRRISLRGDDAFSVVETATIREGVEITALGFLIGDRSLIVGDADGGVSSWQLLRVQGGERLSRTNQFESHAAAVTAISAASRHKGFLTADRSGEIKFRFGTTGETLLTTRAEKEGAVTVVFAPKSNGMLVRNGAGALENWNIDAPHPEATLKSLFGKVWYEGYDEPEYVWQSTGASDDFEPKMSLTPLIYGTLKGTFYALIVAIPLALLGALYASQFMHPTLKSYVKPTVEIMAALPSVVLGFIGGLWLAPMVEPIVPGLFLMPAVLTGGILATVWLYRLLPSGIRTKVRPGTEIFLLIPLVLLLGWLSIQLGYLFERFMLSGDYRRWMFETLGLAFDQRNSLVVGLAMGFAVIPIIFTIAEDSLSSVPNHLRAGSLALGATPWQTAVRVILPTGSPGIFSAVMIGFGRAVGETMIVLMATGNTPIMDGSIFSGFRALSANIAVELPEAPEGGTLYRVLFLAALILFFTTFVVNTAAEMVRLRLRNRFRVL